MKKSKSKRKNPFTLALVFSFVDIFTFVKYVHESELDMFSLCSNSIYCCFASIRYEINPYCFWHISPMARNAKAYRAVGISSCVSNISKIPRGIYLDVLKEIIKNAQPKLSIFCIRPKVKIISSRTVSS